MRCEKHKMKLKKASKWFYRFECVNCQINHLVSRY